MTTTGDFMVFVTIKHRSAFTYGLTQPLDVVVNDVKSELGIDAVLIRNKDNSYYLLSIDKILEYSNAKDINKKKISKQVSIAVFELAIVSIRLINYYSSHMIKTFAFQQLEQFCHYLGRIANAERVAFVNTVEFKCQMSNPKISHSIENYFKKVTIIPRNIKFHRKGKVIMPVIFVPGEREEINLVSIISIKALINTK